MEQKTLHKVKLVGAIMLAVLVLMLLLVPTILAEEYTNIFPVGNIEGESKCLYINPDSAGDPYLKATDTFLITAKNGAWPDGVDRHDVNAILRCEDIIPDYDGPVFQFSSLPSNFGIPCHIVLEPGNTLSLVQTSNWTQTISASGHVVLSCRFNANS